MLRNLLHPGRQGRDFRASMQVSLGIMLAPVTYLTHCTSIVVLLAKLRFDTVGHVAAHSSAERPSRLLRTQEGCQGSMTPVPLRTINPHVLSGTYQVFSTHRVRTPVYTNPLRGPLSDGRLGTFRRLATWWACGSSSRRRSA